MSKPEILIAGAGPSGLILAISLAHQNVPFRIIDAASSHGQASRALAVHARTLELYRPFGLTDRAVSEGLPMSRSHLRERGFTGKIFEVAKIPIGDIGTGLSRYPFILSYAQDLHETMLEDHLNSLGIQVERSTKILSSRQDQDKVEVTIQRPNGDEEIATYAYVCGADGAHSVLRKSIGVGFSGGTYEQVIYVADVKLNEGVDNNDATVNLGSNVVALRLPVRTTGNHRLISFVPDELKDKQDLTFEDVRPSAEELLNTSVGEVNWFSRYHAHHRVADRYRVGRTFLVGDACHIHSPLGGQGMNTGIGDAINLAWKLGHVVKGKAKADILDSYEPERQSFGKHLVATTDTAFTTVITPGILGTLFRRVLIPILLTIALSTNFLRRAIFRTLSQIHISYSTSALSDGGRVGSIRAGDRFPWVTYGDKDNFEVLTGTDWQLHVYGASAPAQLGKDLDWIPVHRFPYTKAAHDAGIQKDSAYLLRPDGYVGLAMAKLDEKKIQAYVNKFGLRL